MIFNSLTFLVFFVALLLIARVPLSWSFKKCLLLFANYLFFASYHPSYVVLLLASTFLDWGLSLAMDAAERPRIRKFLLLSSIVGNLGLLAFFKYSNFILENVDFFLGTLGIVWQSGRMDILLPVGISFYTFQTLSYTIDVYRREIRADRSFLDVAFFVSFFPQLVAGPIVRARDFLPQLKQPRTATPAQFYWGLSLLVWGVFQKMVLSDAMLAPIADKVFAAHDTVGFSEAWVGVLAFSGQIFFDFAGYSICAIGVAACFGFVLTDNFRCPYAARGFSDFWRRWHISLSQWLRDYLYISLGGNRKGKRRTYVNLSTTMLLGGLWHGASWNFVIWGGLHGFYLCAERFVAWLTGGARWTKTFVAQFSLQALTFYLVCISWVFFRAPTLGASIQLIQTMTGGSSHLPTSLLLPIEITVVLSLVCMTLFAHHLLRERPLTQILTGAPWWARSVVMAGLIIGILHIQGTARGFIYFQF